jgi:hypothetical protein
MTTNSSLWKQAMERMTVIMNKMNLKWVANACMSMGSVYGASCFSSMRLLGRSILSRPIMKLYRKWVRACL